jgi:hypothetical protein
LHVVGEIDSIAIAVSSIVDPDADRT